MWKGYRVQFIDLAAQQERIRERIEANIAAVLDHGKYIMGPEIQRLEEKLARYVGVKKAISCASGTDALLLALMAYDIGPGDAIFTTPFTFIATGEVISLLGATPVFVDIDPQTFNIDPSKLEPCVQAVLDNQATDLPLPRSDAPLVPRGIPLIMTTLTPLPDSTACLCWKMRPSPSVPSIKEIRPATWRRSAAPLFSRPNLWAVTGTGACVLPIMKICMK
jgi:hypothetical protein